MPTRSASLTEPSRRESLKRSLSSWRRSLSFKAQELSEDANTTTENGTMFQGFEWHTHPSSTQSHWKRLILLLPHLQRIGITTIWLPPGSKAAQPNSNGYDAYDLYDLGEFDQKGRRATKWGTREDLLELCQSAKRHNIGLIWDAVLNHKAGADATETVPAIKCDPSDRRKELTAPYDIQAWTSFTFPGRQATYSSKHWTSQDFTGTDFDATTHKPGIYKLQPHWAPDVDTTEKGNYDYLMFSDIEHTSPSVRSDLLHWATWLPTTLDAGITGMRLDAMKHYSTAFQIELVNHLQSTFGRDFFVVGEYWTWNPLTLSNIIGKFKGRISLFDVQLVYNFSDFSKERRKPESPVGGDLRRIFEGSLLEMHPQRSVTFVCNHDTQEGQSLEAVVEGWFVAHAYALILLRKEGLPCVFWGDVFGMAGPKARKAAAGGRLPRLVAARRWYAYGPQKEYFDEVDCVGWTRLGSQGFGDGAGLAVVVNSSWETRVKRMFVGGAKRGEVWTDLMGWAYGSVLIDENGFGVFPVGARSISVWTAKGAKGRGEIDRLVWDQVEEEGL